MVPLGDSGFAFAELTGIEGVEGIEAGSGNPKRMAGMSELVEMAEDCNALHHYGGNVALRCVRRYAD